MFVQAILSGSSISVRRWPTCPNTGFSETEQISNGKSAYLQQSACRHALLLLTGIQTQYAGARVRTRDVPL